MKLPLSLLLLVLAVLPLPASDAQSYNSLLPRKAWAANANTLISLYKENGEDKELIQKWVQLDAALFLEYADDDTIPDDKLQCLTLMYFNTKLFRQFLSDKRREIGDEYFFEMNRACQKSYD